MANFSVSLFKTLDWCLGQMRERRDQLLHGFTFMVLGLFMIWWFCGEINGENYYPYFLLTLFSQTFEPSKKGATILLLDHKSDKFVSHIPYNIGKN